MNIILKSFLTLVSLGVALLPTWVWLWMRHVLAPEGFWQNLVMIWYWLVAACGPSDNLSGGRIHSDYRYLVAEF